MIRKLTLSLAMLMGLSTLAHAEFFIPSIEASTDRGLVVEIILKCQSRVSGEKLTSIMSFSKVDKQFCTPRKHCFATIRSAAIESCNADDTILSKLK